MPNAGLVGESLVGGGIVGGPGADSVIIEDHPASLLGDLVESHGDSPHDAATIIEASETVFVGGVGISRVGDAASCGDVISNGAESVSINS